MLRHINEVIMQKFSSVNTTAWVAENYDCFAIYFEFMRSMPHTKQHVLDVFGCIPTTSGPTGAIPSRLHAYVAEEFDKCLKTESEDFNIFHEFNGLHGVFTVDTAGEFETDLENMQLNNSDYCYSIY